MGRSSLGKGRGFVGSSSLAKFAHRKQNGRWSCGTKKMLSNRLLISTIWWESYIKIATGEKMTSNISEIEAARKLKLVEIYGFDKWGPIISSKLLTCSKSESHKSLDDKYKRKVCKALKKKEWVNQEDFHLLLGIWILLTVLSYYTCRFAIQSIHYSQVFPMVPITLKFPRIPSSSRRHYH